ncbi:MAG: DNA polymerase III subunit delta [Methyloceanibacter sp.]|uniref:DNA polymerase III subunit delta n=1 Tax=Methyloceanibacter sp. TaxID=1965321 RepID=UPI003EE3633A
MVAHKASAVPRFLKSPDPNCRVVLLYGPDAGLVSERAAALTRTLARRQGADAEVIRLDDRDFAEDPARLDVELRTQPMFASAKVVRVTAGSRLDVSSLKALLAEPSDNALIVEAGNLRPDSGLRKLFEKLPDAAALPCYADERDLAAVIDAELAEAGLAIDRETKTYLMSRLGADQAMSRTEVAKLALYAQGGGRITHDDIAAVVGDAAEIALENFVYAASGGEAKDALRELQRLAAAGTDRAAALSALARHFTRLHQVASREGNLDEAVRTLRPPLHYKRRDAFAAHCRKWGAKRLASALPLIQETIRRSRRSPDLDSAFAERLLLTLTSKV